MRPWLPPTSAGAAGQVGGQRRAQPVGGDDARRRRGRRPTRSPAAPASRRCGRPPVRGRRCAAPDDPAPRPPAASSGLGRRPAGRRRRRPPAGAAAGRRRAPAAAASEPADRWSGSRPRRAGAAGHSPSEVGAGAPANGPDARAGRPGRSRSTPARRAGLSTIGRPAVLRLVLTTTGRPVRSLERRPASGRPAARSPGRRSGPGRCRRRGRRPGCRSRHAGADVVHEQHVRAGQRAAAEDLGGALGQHHRRDRPELLAALDVVEPLEVLRPAGVRRAASGAPAPAGRTRCGPGTRRRCRWRPGRSATVVGDVGGPVVAARRAVRSPPRARRRVHPRPRSRAGQRRAARRRPLRRPQSAAPERGARVAGGRLHPDLVERALGEQPGVGHAVERDAAGQRQRRGSPVRSCSQRARSSSTSSRTACTLAARSACSAVHVSARRRRGLAKRGPVDAARCGSRRRRWRAPARAARRGSAACRRRPAPSPCTRRWSAGSPGAR